MTVVGQPQSVNKKMDSLANRLETVTYMMKQSEAEVRRLQYLLTAKEMALRSSELKDSTFQGLIAIQAHTFWKSNNGSPADTDIYQGLYRALLTFKDSMVKTLPPRIDKVSNQEYALTKLMAAQLCSRMKRNMMLAEWNMFASQLPYERTCPATK